MKKLASTYAFLLSSMLATFVNAEEQFLLELQDNLTRLVCTEKFFECADRELSSCSILADDAFSFCPANELVASMAGALDGESNNKLVVEFGDYGRCFSNKLYQLSDERGVPKHCIDEAVNASFEKKVEEVRKYLESRK